MKQTPKFKKGDKIIAERKLFVSRPPIISVGTISDKSHPTLYHIVWQNGIQASYSVKDIDERGYVLYDSPEGKFLRL